MISNGVCNGVTSAFVTLTPTQPDPAQPSPAQPLSFWSPLHHVVQLGDAASRLGMMSIQPDTIHEPVAGEATIEGIDLDADVPCGHRSHAGDYPAAYLVRVHHCIPPWTVAICERCWSAMGRASFVSCRECRGTYLRDECLTIVEVLR